MTSRRSAWNPEWRRILQDIYRCGGRIPLSCESTGTLKEGKARFLRSGAGSNIEFRRIRMAMVFCQGCDTEGDLDLVEDPGGETLASADLIFDHIVGITTWENCPDVRAVLLKLRRVRRKQVRLGGKTSSQSIREYMRNVMRPPEGQPLPKLRRASKRPLVIEQRPMLDGAPSEAARAAAAMALAEEARAGLFGANSAAEAAAKAASRHDARDEEAWLRGPSANPYLDQFLAASTHWPAGTHDLGNSEPRPSPQRADCIRALVTDATVLQKHYAYSVPDERALHVLAAFSPLLELGARSAYWRCMLRRRGVHVTSSSEGYGLGHHELHNPAGVKAAENATFARDNLTLLVYHSEAVGDVRSDVLERFRGPFVACVGEPEEVGEVQPGHRERPPVLEMLHRNFAFILAIPLRYRWPHARDSITLWMRRMPGTEDVVKSPPVPDFVRLALAEGDARLNADERQRGFGNSSAAFAPR